MDGRRQSPFRSAFNRHLGTLADPESGYEIGALGVTGQRPRKSQHHDLPGAREVELGDPPDVNTPAVFGDFISDPKCYFDPDTGRFFLTELQIATVVKMPFPAEMSTSTSTQYASMPKTAALKVLKSMETTRSGRLRGSCRP